MTILESFNLEIYKASLEEQSNIEFNELNDIYEIQKQMQEGYDAVIEWMLIENRFEEDKDLLEAFMNESNNILNENNNKGKGITSDDFQKISSTLISTLALGADFANKNAMSSNTYTPVPSTISVTKLGDKGNRISDNVNLFFGGIATWIKNIVLKIIDSLSRAIRRLFGLSIDDEPSIKANNLKLSFEKAKAIEKRYMIDYNKDNKHIKFDNLNPNDKQDLEIINGTFFRDSYENEDGETLSENMNGRFTNSYSASREDRSSNPNSSNINSVTVESLDISRELMDLKEYMSRFFELFDNAIGSNDEMLFGTADMELLLRMFKNTFDDIKKYSGQTTAVGGKLTSTDIISSSRLKDNLLRTKTNTDNLSNAFRQCTESVQNILKIINTKQYIRNTSGVNNVLISSATYYQLSSIIKVLKNRENIAKKLESKMNKMHNKYNSLVKEIEKARMLYAQLGANISFTIALQERLTDLFTSSKFMTQTIALRFSTIGLYIKLLRDTRNMVIAVNTVNSKTPSVSFTGFKKQQDRMSLLTNGRY